MKKVLLFFCVVFLFSCRTPPESLPDKNVPRHWVTTPENGALVIIGAIGKQSKKSMDIEVARDEAAKKVAMFYGIQGSVTIVNADSGSVDDYVSISEVDITYAQDYEKYREFLVFDEEKDVIRDEGTIFVRFTYKTLVPQSIKYVSSLDANGSPDWINKPPKIDGYLVGVGYAGKHQLLRDAVAKSFQAAAAAIIKQLDAKGEGSVVVHYSSLGDYRAETTSHLTSKGSLKEFMVIEYYFDSGGVYTLAIAKAA
ncbi:hypothetical protein AGMMS50268_22920 [Spirochaetia bacterium]|nr:hypothetical protein AGMMS50268_22920 [Spirochaetia bacterium]